MDMRRIVAAFTLVALPAIVILAQSTFVTGALAHWAYYWGWSHEEALMYSIFGALYCAGFGPVGGAACGITGAL